MADTNTLLEMFDKWAGFDNPEFVTELTHEREGFNAKMDALRKVSRDDALAYCNGLAASDYDAATIYACDWNKAHGFEPHSWEDGALHIAPAFEN